MKKPAVQLLQLASVLLALLVPLALLAQAVQRDLAPRAQGVPMSKTGQRPPPEGKTQKTQVAAPVGPLPSRLERLLPSIGAGLHDAPARLLCQALLWWSPNSIP